MQDSDDGSDIVMDLFAYGLIGFSIIVTFYWLLTDFHII